MYISVRDGRHIRDVYCLAGRMDWEHGALQWCMNHLCVTRVFIFLLHCQYSALSPALAGPSSKSLYMVEAGACAAGCGAWR